MNSRILSKFQTGLTKNKRTTGNIFVTKTTIYRYLKIKTGQIYWCLVDLEKALTESTRKPYDLR
jgi:hypothetical protein